MRNNKNMQINYSLFILISIFLFSGCRDSNLFLSDYQLFKKFILDPIPKSVADLQINRPESFSDPVYVINFKINNEDIKTILEAKPFVEYSRWEIDTEIGALFWTYEDENKDKYTFDGTTTYVRGSTKDAVPLDKDRNGHIKPDWFSPDQWHKARFYAYKINRNTNNPIHVITYILIYDEGISEAYFIRSVTGGL
ncbi:MAG: hypothetical protein JW715_11660 [Sedimentisphaerales bacterium]|nr:hypothetical protein [Sedimentisphaerales bacterium]